MVHSVAHLCVYTPLAERGAGMTLHGHRPVMAQLLLRRGSRAARPCYLLGPTPPQAWPNFKAILEKSAKTNLKFNLSLSESDRLRFELKIYL